MSYLTRSFGHWTGERLLAGSKDSGVQRRLCKSHLRNALSMPSVPGLLQREADRFVENRVLSDNKGNSDRTAKLRDSWPLHLQPLPRGYSRVKQLFYFGTPSRVLTTRAVLIAPKDRTSAVPKMGCEHVRLF